MRAPESPFESYKSKRISFFANLIFSEEKNKLAKNKIRFDLYLPKGD